MRYKTWLFVPALEKYLFTGHSPEADAVIYDLEDSIREEEKDAALLRLGKRLAEASGSEIYVRVNTGERAARELEFLSGFPITGFMLPKVESAADIVRFQGHFGRKKVLALVESISGVMNIECIASAECLYGIAFGGEDYCRELGVETNDLAMQYARGRLLLAAKLRKKYCLDTISMEYRDEGVFTEQFAAAMQMGFDSKLLIHPAQAAAVRKLKQRDDLAGMRRIIALYDASRDGLVFVDGQWYEKPHIDMLRRRVREMEEQ